MACRPWWQQWSELEQRTSSHCGASNNVFTDGLVHEVFGRNNNASARGDIVFGDDTKHSTEVVGM
jgi:hypothetical protein